MPLSESESASSTGSASEGEDWNPLTPEQQASWAALEQKRPRPQSEGAPTEEEKAAMKAFKAEKNAFLATLGEAAKEYIKDLEAQAREAAKPKKGGEKKGDAATAAAGSAGKAQARQDDEKKAKKQAEAEAKRQADEEKRLKKQQLADDRRLRKPIETLCKWLQIRGSYLEEDEEAIFEIKLPKWLLKREAFLEEHDLDEGPVMLDVDEMQEMVMGAVRELATLYFGEEYEMDLPMDNLVERAQSMVICGKKDNLPPWLSHMTYPQSPEEVALSLGDVKLEKESW